MMLLVLEEADAGFEALEPRFGADEGYLHRVLASLKPRTKLADRVRPQVGVDTRSNRLHCRKCRFFNTGGGRDSFGKVAEKNQYPQKVLSLFFVV